MEKRTRSLVYWYELVRTYACDLLFNSRYSQAPYTPERRTSVRFGWVLTKYLPVVWSEECRMRQIKRTA